MRHVLPWGGLVVACVGLLLACSQGGPAQDGDLERLRGFWENESGLYYLDLSGQDAASFVLPNVAATLSPLERASLTRQELLLSDGRSQFVLKLDRLPPALGTRRCLEIDATRLCEATRE